MTRVIAATLAFLLLGGLAGCGSAPMALPPESAATPAEAPRVDNSDQTKLKDGLTGREMSASEVADLSDRLLANGTNALNDQETMARLELLILKTMKGPWASSITTRRSTSKPARNSKLPTNSTPRTPAPIITWPACSPTRDKFTKSKARNGSPGNSLNAPPSKWSRPASWSLIMPCTSKTRNNLSN